MRGLDGHARRCYGACARSARRRPCSPARRSARRIALPAHGPAKGARNMSRLVRIGFIGCGAHATNSLYPTFRLGVTRKTALGDPVGELVACCDLDEDKARAN